MRNNVLPKISLAKSGLKRERFNMSHDVNTTFGWGEIQPLQCKLVVPNTKTTLSIDSLVRLAPMVAPTFGRVKYKQWSQFVPCSDIFGVFDQFLAQSRVTSLGNDFTPRTLPSFPLKWLSALCLIGANISVYLRGTRSAPELMMPYGVDGAAPSSVQNIQGASEFFNKFFVFPGDSSQSFQNVFYDLSSSVTRPIARFNLNELTKGVEGLNDNTGLNLVVPVQNGFLGTRPSAGQIDWSKCNLFANRKSSSNGNADSYESASVSLDGADLLFTPAGQVNFVFAFKLSDFGKRLRKILLGCGYQIDLSSKKRVSILPLLAFYRAYYGIFGLQLYRNFDNTYCGDFIRRTKFQMVDTFGVPEASNLNSYLNGTMDSDKSLYSCFVNFIIRELSECFYTDPADFVSAHLSGTPVSADGITGPEGGTGGAWVDVHGAPGIVPVGRLQNPIEQDSESVLTHTNHEFLTKVQHGALDEEYLKRLYKWTNRNTIVGKKIDELLRVQGLGSWCDATRSDFIGYNETNITISDVVSTSNTFKSSDDEGALLGEYGGRGLQYNESKKMTYENDCFGYIITFATVVPSGGYCQGVDPTIYDLKKFDLYNPEFDSLGVELTDKSAVVGSCDAFLVENRDVDVSDRSFGQIPRYTRYKVSSNIANGDFSLRGTRSTYLPYMLDRWMNYRDLTVSDLETVDANGSRQDYYSYYVGMKKLPIAGLRWRYPTKYPWLGNYNRIFANVGNDKYEKYTPWNSGDDNDLALWIYFANNYDNFLAHNVLNEYMFAPMKSLADSFETDDDKPSKQMKVEKK